MGPKHVYMNVYETGIWCQPWRSCSRT